MKLLAIDQSTDSFAYSIYENDQLIDYKYFHLKKIKPESSTQERINTVKKVMIKAITKNKINLVVLEDIFLNTFGNSKYTGAKVYKILAELLGVLEDALYENKILYSVVKPSTWRSTCKIKGKDKIQKINAIKFVKEVFDIDVEEDTAEAICIGYHASKKILPKLVDNCM